MEIKQMILLAVAFLTAPVRSSTQFHASWSHTGDAKVTSESLTVIWDGVKHHHRHRSHQLEARFCEGEHDCHLVQGRLKHTGTSRGSLWMATAKNLKPSTTYRIEVMEDSEKWSSDVFNVRTAPAPTSHDQSFQFVFVGDLGLMDRADGLSNSTERVVSLISSLDPLLVLLGGDLAYSDTDSRYSSVEQSIDMFFEQMKPFASKSVLMPTYGNHEKYEGLKYWKRRFVLPHGVSEDTGSFYSFTVASVRFISIAAPKCNKGLDQIGLEWVEAELKAAANDPDVKWAIPFFHVAPFANGHSHPSNMILRQQLLGIFTNYGVRIVLNAHDQNYERTHPVLASSSEKDKFYRVERSENINCYDSSTKGTIFVKASPGGKLSNQHKDFSHFRDKIPEAYTAFREDGHHHILNVKVSKDGNDLHIQCLGIKDEHDDTPAIIDAFHYRLGNECNYQKNRAGSMLSNVRKNDDQLVLIK
eukprot:jgi/Bigna1/70642/fgenesh1_pg.12_\